MTAPPADTSCHLVLVGGGHAHVGVLRSLAMRPQPALRLTVVSPDSHATYSGMVPGHLAGTYPLRACQIDVRALAARAGAAFLADRVVRVDAAARRLHLAGRPPLAYDLACFDIGSRPRLGERVAADAPVVMVKPIEVAATGLDRALREAPPGGHRAVVVGAGAGGVEIALALATRLGRQGAVTLCDRAPRPLGERGDNAARVVLATLAERGIEFIGGCSVSAAERDGVHLADGRRLPASLIVWATGAAGPTLFAASALPVDERGFLVVGDDLRCREHPALFAAGDCAVLSGHPDLPRAGVYAVRQGPVLADNLRRASRGDTRLRTFRPQRRFLSLLNCGDGSAILSYGALAWRGRLAWRLKDHIDRTFIRRYALPPLDVRMPGEMAPCGGCAAKLGADVLGRVLTRLHIPASHSVLLGLEAADDAAVFTCPPDMAAVATTDAFPPFSGDLHLVGAVAAVNAASDVYAMGGTPAAALAFVCLPRGDEQQIESDLEQMLHGALEQLGALDIALVGGHTIAGEQPLIGFAVHGFVDPQRILRKGGAVAGDAIVLTKALGTGVVLAAANAGSAGSDWTEAAHRSMLRSNRGAMELLLAHGVRACTDVSGFGLAGHLAEMLRAGAVAARLERAAIPALPGARELLDNGWRSSFHAVNERAQATSCATTLPTLLVDPQTSGGLLAAVPAVQLAALRAAAATAGEEVNVIGEIVAADTDHPAGTLTLVD